MLRNRKPAVNQSVMPTLHGSTGPGLAPEVPQEEALAAIERLIASPIFQKSEAHCRLIRYLAEHSLCSPAEPLKEYQIATEALGRPSHFDPQTDSSVRVQIARLRHRLEEYYKSTGANDPIQIEIPKGKYQICFQKNLPTGEIPPQLTAQPIPQSRTPITPLLATALLAALFAWGFYLWTFRKTFSDIKIPHPPSNLHHNALAIFWTPFLHSALETLVLYRDRSFVGDPSTGLKPFNPDHHTLDYPLHQYTAVGEVGSVLELSRVLTAFGHPFRVQPASLLTPDDALKHNLIFVGKPGKLPPQIPPTRDFILCRLVQGAHDLRIAVADARISSSHPKIRAIPSGNYRNPIDYAIIALEHSNDRSRWTLYLEGTSTAATQAAVDFVSSSPSIADLLRQLHVTQPAQLQPFESLLRIELKNNQPLHSEILDLRPLPQTLP